MTDYEKISELATEAVRKFPRNRVIEIVWMPLQLLYVEMVKRKEIPGISELDLKTKRAYWKEVSGLLPGRSRNRKMWAVQAIYLYDLIKD